MIRSLVIHRRVFIRKLFRDAVLSEKPGVNAPVPTPDPSPPKPVPPPKPTSPTPSPTEPGPAVLFKLQNLQHFTAYGQLQPQTAEDGEYSPNSEFHVPTGRSWSINQLRLKSNEDLHKLWYVLLREKNRILGDSRVAERLTGQELDQSSLEKVQNSMSRITYVVNERQAVGQRYRRRLEDSYCEDLRAKLQEGYDQFNEEQKVSPPISYTLLRAKFTALREGVDNLEYIEKEVGVKERKQQLKDYLKDKYSYGRKQIVNPEKLKPEQLERLKRKKRQPIYAFRNHIERQLAENQTSISQEEVLRAHIRNWKVLDLKQRRVVLHYINQRRAKDAKDIFVQELNLLAQKIAYEEKGVLPAAPTKTRAT